MKVAVDNLDWTSLLDSVEEALIIIDAEGHILFLNQAAEQFQLLTDPPIRSGAIIFDSIPPQRRDFTKGIVRDVIQFQKPYSTNAEYPLSKGKTSYFEIRYSPITAGDYASQVLIEARDVTQQKIFENKITTVATELSSLIENANAVIIGIDTQGYITEWNEMSSRITGYTKNDALTKAFSGLLIDKGHRLNFSRSMKEVLSGQLISNYELPVIARDQRKLIFLINATPRKNASGQVIGILLVGQDITELSEYRKTLERKVDERTKALQVAIQKEKELVEMKNKFVSIASHEFRTPLSTISFAAESIRNYFHQLTAEEIKRKLIKIEDQASHMTNLLEDILTLGKSETGKIKVKRISLDLKEFMDSLIEEVRATVKEEREINFTFSCASNKVNADDKLLRNVFNNMLTNALKFSAAGTPVTVAVSDFKGDILIEVTDEGIGIEEDELTSVFESFQRGSNATAVQGTGLGLSILKKAVELMGGSVQVKSSLNKGSTFRVQIPIQ